MYVPFTHIHISTPPLLSHYFMLQSSIFTRGVLDTLTLTLTLCRYSFLYAVRLSWTKYRYLKIRNHCCFLLKSLLKLLVLAIRVSHIQHSSLLCKWNHKNTHLNPAGGLKTQFRSYPLLFDLSLILIIIWQVAVTVVALDTTLLVIQNPLT